jgi:hypothetical protein
LDQLSDKLELFSEAEYGLFKDSDFFWSPFFKGKYRGHRIDKNIQIAFFVDMYDGVKVMLNWFFLLFWIGLVNLALRSQYLKYWMSIQL